ncbi:hypothetical protein BSZ39_01685 [Bowdeniella nasicola]|uniref:Transglutaminase-like domain-containing protein n=1 Tax=Bowdeniella nasicola TaxID=208480 RepID=A0A1Q5Q5D1_9ACTO|nr:transglutaminaseTgpA domain-containing protein [Bowdeniella nasicola]OKL54912.1 hypothetical protein BSZ39_01685 [Bowdeniella nasicola]
MPNIRPTLGVLVTLAGLGLAVYLAAVFSLRVGAVIAGILIGIIVSGIIGAVLRRREIVVSPVDDVITAGEVPTWRGDGWILSLPPVDYGYAHLPIVELRAMLPFGLGHGYSPVHSREDVLILPKAAPVDTDIIATVVRSQRAISATTIGAMQARRYIPGDSPRAVHWKASAKTGELMSKVAELEPHPTIALAIDNRSGSAVHFGNVLATSLGVVQTLARVGADIVVVGPAGQILTLGDSERHIHETLAVMSFGEELPAPLGYLDDARVVLWAGDGPAPQRLRGIPVRQVPVTGGDSSPHRVTNVTDVSIQHDEDRPDTLAARLMRSAIALLASLATIGTVGSVAPGGWLLVAAVLATLIVAAGAVIRSTARFKDSSLTVAAIQLLIPIAFYLLRFGLSSPAEIIGSGTHQLDTMYPGDHATGALSTLLALITSLLAIAFDTDMAAARSSAYLWRRGPRQGFVVGRASGSGLFTILVLLVIAAIPEIFGGRFLLNWPTLVIGALIIAIALLQSRDLRLQRLKSFTTVATVTVIVLGALTGLAAPMTTNSTPLAQQFGSGIAPLYRITGATALDPQVSLIQSRIQTRMSPVARTSRPEYLRTAVLDRFDGSRWSMTKEPDALTSAPTDPAIFDQNPELWVELAKPASGLLPLPVAPVALQIDEGIAQRIAPDASGVRIEDPAALYRVSYRPQRGIDEWLNGAVAPEQDPERSVDIVPDEARAQRAREIVKGSTDPSIQVGELLRYFSQFSYSLNVATPLGVDPLEHFLTERAGYCEQFAATFALFANDLGIPARVAVGYAPGRPTDDGYVITASQAHAWVEVYLDGTWLTVDPTPGGPAIERESQLELGTFPRTLPSAPPSPLPTNSTLEPDAPEPSAPTGGGERPDTGNAPDLGAGPTQVTPLSPWIPLAALIAVMAVAIVVARARLTRDPAYVLADLDDGLRVALRKSGQQAPAGMSEIAMGEKLAGCRSDLAEPARDVAQILTTARYQPEGVTLTAAERRRAHDLARQLRRRS